MAKKMHSFFTSQLARIIQSLGPLDPAALAMIEVVFNVESEHRRFMRVVEPFLSRALFVGFDMQAELTNGDGRKSIGDLLSPLPFSNVPGMVSQFHQLARKEYWRDIQRGTKKKLTEVIANGLGQGHSSRKMAKAIQTTLGGRRRRNGH